MASERAVALQDDPLRSPRRRASYNAAEQQFSLIVQQRLNTLLEGKSNSLALLRRYPTQPDRLGVMTTPARLPRDQLRLSTVEGIIWDALDFVRPDAVGGPVAQNLAPDGSVVERQIFSTRYPHIVIERTDRYVGDAPDPVEITWCLQRVQNQRSQTQFNRLLDAANLAFELLRAIR
jgi:signal transduction histidine kinase